MTRTEYKKTIVPKLQTELGLTNPHAVPELKAIVLNCGMGEAIADKKVLDAMAKQFAIITGQKPVVTKARKAISSFKIREGMPIGLKVTLRGRRMYDFLTRLIAIVLPRVRDFRGVSGKSFDGSGNYSLGFSEQMIFPELDYSVIDKTRGFQLTFVTTAKSDAHARSLLALMGIPFEKSEH